MDNRRRRRRRHDDEMSMDSSGPYPGPGGPSGFAMAPLPPPPHHGQSSSSGSGAAPARSYWQSLAWWKPSQADMFEARPAPPSYDDAMQQPQPAPSGRNNAAAEEQECSSLESAGSEAPPYSEIHLDPVVVVGGGHAEWFHPYRRTSGRPPPPLPPMQQQHQHARPPVPPVPRAGAALVLPPGPPLPADFRQLNRVGLPNLGETMVRLMPQPSRIEIREFT